MSKLLFLLPSIFLLITCNNDKLKNKPTDLPEKLSEVKTLLPIDKIHFDFDANQSSHGNGWVKVKAALSNENTDTVYFLTWSCDGLIHQLNYDTASFALFPHYLCNASGPVIVKIPPSEQFKFEADFVVKKRTNKMRLGFDFCRVAKNFELTLDSVKKFNANRTATILWMEEKTIK